MEIPANDLLELELNNTLDDLKGYVLQAKSNPDKFTPFYYELVSKIADVACEFASLAANGEMPAKFAGGM